MRIRLKAPFFFNNHRYEPGDIVDLPEGVQGPHKSRTVSHDKIDYGTNPSIDANRILGEIALEPLFDVIEDEAPADQPHAASAGEPVALLDKPDDGRSAQADAELHPSDQT